LPLKAVWRAHIVPITYFKTLLRGLLLYFLLFAYNAVTASRSFLAWAMRMWQNSAFRVKRPVRLSFLFNSFVQICPRLIYLRRRCLFPWTWFINFAFATLTLWMKRTLSNRAININSWFNLSGNFSYFFCCIGLSLNCLEIFFFRL